jgi:hypothetical protein
MRAYRFDRHIGSQGLIITVLIALVLAFPVGALASHQFADVPTGSTFHGDIDALVDAGVTAGCGSGNYCPNDPVTRGQMAAFMNRLGALAPGRVPVVNADRLDGYHANALSRVAQTTSSTQILLNSATTTLSTVTINAPTAGFVHVTGTLTAYSFDAGCGCEVIAWINAGGGTNQGQQNEVVDSSGADVASISLQYVFPVSPGSRTFHLVARNEDAAAGDATAQYRQLVATFTPFGSTGGTTLGATDEAGGADAGTPAGD